MGQFFILIQILIELVHNCCKFSLCRCVRTNVYVRKKGRRAAVNTSAKALRVTSITQPAKEYPAHKHPSRECPADKQQNYRTTKISMAEVATQEWRSSCEEESEEIGLERLGSSKEKVRKVKGETASLSKFWLRKMLC